MTEVIEGEIITETPEVIAETPPEPEKTPEEIEYSKAVQKRIDKATWEKNEAKRELERERAERAALAIEIERLKAGQPKPDSKTLDNGAPDPAKYPAGRYDPDYLEALTDYKTDVKMRQILDEQKKNANISQVRQKIDTLEAAAQEAYPDYSDTIGEFLSHSLAKVPVFQDILQDCDNPVEMAYYLGKNPEELDKLATMTANQATRHLAKLETKIEKPAPSEAKKSSDAPKPIAPLGSAKSTAATKDPSKMTMEEYAEYWKTKNK